MTSHRALTMKERLPSSSIYFFIFVVGILLWLTSYPPGADGDQQLSLGSPGRARPFTLNNYLVAYTNPLTHRMVFNTLVFAGGGTAITVFIAVLFTWLLERTDMPLRNLCWTPLLIPLAMPGLLFSMAYVLLFMRLKAASSMFSSVT